MKVKFGARCNGMNEADIDIEEVPDDTSDKDLEDMAREHGETVTGFDYWYEKI